MPGRSNPEKSRKKSHSGRKVRSGGAVSKAVPPAPKLPKALSGTKYRKRHTSKTDWMGENQQKYLIRQDAVQLQKNRIYWGQHGRVDPRTGLRFGKLDKHNQQALGFNYPRNYPKTTKNVLRNKQISKHFGNVPLFNSPHSNF